MGLSLAGKAHICKKLKGPVLDGLEIQVLPQILSLPPPPSSDFYKSLLPPPQKKRQPCEPKAMRFICSPQTFSY